MSALYYYGQDGEIADESIVKLFGLGTKELRFSDKIGKDVYDVVGFVYKENKILVVFPKHYFSKTEIDFFNCNNAYLGEDIRLLYNVIKKYRETENTNATARSYLGSRDGFDADYPFKSFYEVYDYFQKYGLYKEREERIIEGASGKVSWKDTIRKSNKIVSGGNLIFSPFYVKKKNYNNVFLTECMIFIIDYTIDFFRDFLSLKKTGGKHQFDFLNDIDYVIMQLNICQSKVFKDSQKRLIQSMIEFFLQYRGKAKGGKIHVKIRYFDKIWQEMINCYLNKHFIGMKNGGTELEFDENVSSSVVQFTYGSFHVDVSEHDFSIEVDHLATTNTDLYIFDSKYYYEANKLDYKQYSYIEILRYKYPSRLAIYSALLLPGRKESKIHFELAPEYVGIRNTGNQIIEQYIETKRIMKSYMDN